MSNRKYTATPNNPSPVAAIYTAQTNPMHQCNPCIEVLENHLEPEEIVTLTGSFPPYDEGLRYVESRFDRMSMLRDFVASLRLPFVTDVPLYVETRQLVCSVYIRNHILSPHYWDDTPPLFTPTQKYDFPDWRPPDLYGFLVIGDSGCGKSTSLEQISRLLRRVIIHERYLNEPLPLRQIPMLIVRCPDNGAIGAFLQELLNAVDALVHTDYHARYVKSKDLTALKKAVKTVCRNHNIGVIFVDEAQNLASGKNVEDLVKYLARFNETVNVPLVLVGTPDVREVWEQSFSASRRLSGSGPIELLRFPLTSHKESPLYKFCMKLGRYQFTREITSMTAKIIDALGEVSGGNPDLLKKAWIYVQGRSIQFERDDRPLTDQDILAIKGKFSAVEKAIDLLVNNRWDELREAFKDLDPHEVIFIPPPEEKSPNSEESIASKQAANNVPKPSEEPATDMATTANDTSIVESTLNDSVRNPLLNKAKRTRAKVDKLLGSQAESKNNTSDLNSGGYDQLKDQGLIGFA